MTDKLSKDVLGELTTASGAPDFSDRQLERAIGSQIRSLRVRNGLSIGDLSLATNLSKGMLSKIENGQISASLKTLKILSNTLNVPISNLFSTYDEDFDCSFVSAGQGVTIDRRGTKAGHIYELLGHALEGDIVIEPYLITFTEDAETYTNFKHEGIELIHMLSGRVNYTHGGETYNMKPGDTLLFNSGAFHGPAEMIEKPVKYLSVIAYRRDK